MTFGALWRRLLKRIGLLDSETLGLIRRLFALSFRTYWRRYAFAISLMAVVAATTAGTAWIISYVVDEIFVTRNIALLVPLSLAIILISVAKGAANYAQEVVMARIGNRIVAENQERVYAHVLKFGLGYFTTQPSSALIMKLSGGANAARDVLNTLVVSFGRDLLTLIGLVAVMVLQAPVLSIGALIVAPIAIIGVTALIKRVRAIVSSQFYLAIRVVQIIQETVHGARIIKTFNLGNHLRGEMREAVLGVEQRANRIARLTATTGPLMETLGGVAIGLVALYAGWETIAGRQSPGDFMSFITAFLLAYEPAKRLARLQVNLEQSMLGVRILFGVLDTRPDPIEADGPALEFVAGTIEFRDVVFAYRSEAPVLKGINFRIERNSKVALVGPSGAGKTTILTLVPRLYDPDKGQILIDGQDLRDVSAESVRGHIAFVSQDIYLFAGTVRDNIRIGRQEAPNEDVERAARDAYAHDFITALAQGYDTDVGENGVQLSGGERQRIGIARALLKRAPIILLDEATSSLDSESEKQVQLALDRLMQDRTIIVIAHRLSTILNADRILVIDGGMIVEQGSHRELLARGGLYERLYRHQFADHQPAERPRAMA